MLTALAYILSSVILYANLSSLSCGSIALPPTLIYRFRREVSKKFLNKILFIAIAITLIVLFTEKYELHVSTYRFSFGAKANCKTRSAFCK